MADSPGDALEWDDAREEELREWREFCRLDAVDPWEPDLDDHVEPTA